jgi:predicted porin
VRKLLICALALGGFAASAQAADLGLDGMKDPLPDTLTYKGVTLYGTVDVGYAYQTEGNGPNGSFYPGLNYLINKTANQSQSTLIGNGLSQSTVGLKVEESIGMGFVAIGKVETGFNPTYGELADACKSLLQTKSASGGSVVTSAGDGSRCGQAINGEGYAGLSNAAFGTLTAGRQNSLIQSGLGSYDPVAGSYAFSLLAYSGGAAGGIGSTETARWDNSVKYTYQYGPAHAAVEYASGSTDSAIFGHAIAGNVGVTWKGLSVDGYYTKEDGAVNLGATTITTGYTTATPPVAIKAPALNAVVTNNEAWAGMAKYTFNVNPLLGLGAGGYKDDAGAKLTLFAGYVHTDMVAANDQSQYVGMNTIGGYQISATGTTWTGTKTIETAWGGATYAVGAWTITGAYYHESVNAYGSTAAGNIQWASGVVDYAFTKHFDIYGGVSYSTVDGGQAAGFAHTDTTNAITGLRLKF